MPSLGGPFSLGARGVRGFEMVSVPFTADDDEFAASSPVASAVDSPLMIFFAFGFLVDFFFSAPEPVVVSCVASLVESV